jgi:hypothetical protein
MLGTDNIVPAGACLVHHIRSDMMSQKPRTVGAWLVTE